LIERLDRLEDQIEIQRMLQRAWGMPSLETLRPAFERIDGRLAAGVGRALVLYDVDHIPKGLLLWHWNDAARTYAHGTTLYTEDTETQTAEALVEELFRESLNEPALKAISVGVRGETPGAREALLKRDAVFFERCQMVCDLKAARPAIELKNGYYLARWTEDVNPQAEAMAAAATIGTIDEVAVPDAMAEEIVDLLRQLRRNEYPGVTGWNAEASLVMLDAQGHGAGYIAMCTVEGMAFVVDIAVHPDHRRQGLARALMMEGMRVCREQGYVQMGLAVTTRNPARNLYETLGFEAVECGENAVWWRDGRQMAWR